MTRPAPRTDSSDESAPAGAAAAGNDTIPVVQEEDMPDIATGAALKRHRERRGVSQAELGKRLDYHEKTIARLEGQKTIPRAVGIAAAYVLTHPTRRRR